ncbi:MAG TPA: AsnC family protein [Actinophytocola sp.]|uniref:AsnC family protein n=1 Tax=Actinophytocola sp. TaxID=1872138 RepID=UPI002DDCE596|nr:AsnC family protein [Actinophytocola sp.]HEV2781965.1 AsnC family protein [Actinophytocola sp.]
MRTVDPIDARLLGLVAELGRAAVHEVAARLGMDPREVASRLVALSASGLPLLVGVECDPNGLRAALARVNVAQPYGVPSGGFAPPVQGPPYPGYQPGPSGPHPVHGAPSGPYPPSPPSNPFPVQTGPPSNPFPAAPAPMSTWGPPQSSSWARGDRQAPPARPVQPSPQDRTQPTVRTDRPNGSDSRTGKVGATLLTEGLEGERLAIQLIEVVDPADYLFTAAGYRLQEGERSIVVHTELTNRGGVPFQTLPDLYLVLVTADGRTISKAPVSLSSRPPHRIGVAPGETAGGHTVYVVPESTEVTSVRWSPRPDEESRTLTWSVADG